MSKIWKRDWNSEDILTNYRDSIKFDQISELRQQRLSLMNRDHWAPLQECLAKLPRGAELSLRNAEYKANCRGPIISIGQRELLTDDEFRDLEQAVKLLMPWRKGPFNLFGIEIDAEWRSDKKWQRIEPELDSLSGKRVADIGCSNGYYMFRAATRAGGEPECILGLDPSEQFYFSFELFQRFIQNPRLQYEPLGVEHMPLFPNFFDVVFCLGILYHHRNPLDLLQGIRSAMKPGAQIIVETQAVPGEESYALCPAKRYAKARNVYFVPTAPAVEAWLLQAGFSEVETFSQVLLTCDEQRRTEFMTFESLEDFLDPNDQTKTVEGYPAPWRVAVKARK